jgi:hypothetical protein
MMPLLENITIKNGEFQGTVMSIAFSNLILYYRRQSDQREIDVLTIANFVLVPVKLLNNGKRA